MGDVRSKRVLISRPCELGPSHPKPETLRRMVRPLRFDICSRLRLSRALLVFAAITFVTVAAACSTEASSPAVDAAANAGETATAIAAETGVSQSPEARRGGTLRIAQAADPASCDLHSARALSYQAVHPCNPLLSQIVRVSADDHSVIEPDLATEWSVSGDGRTWSFELRDGVLWHDGSTFSVDDAVFSLRRAIDLPSGIAPGRASAIGRYISDPQQIRAEDGKLVIETDFAAASFLPNLASVYVSIYPRQATLALDPPSMTAFESVVGTGPFKAGEAIRGSRYTLVRNDQYYMEGRPYLDQIEFLVIPEPAVRMAALRSHAVDSIAIITEPEAKELEENFAGRITVFSTPSAGGNTVQLNLNRPPFDNPNVRRAVNLAISRSDAELVLGKGYEGAILPPGGQFAFPASQISSLPGYGDANQNRALSITLLAEAGFPDGFSTTINTSANPFSQLLADFISGQLAQVGIDAKVVPLESVEYQERITNGDFDMIGHSHSFALDDPDSVLPSHYSCGGAENFPGLCDQAIDDLIEQQSRELDPDRRRELLTQIQRLIWEKDAKIWFQWSARRMPVWNNVVGLQPGGPSLYQGRRLDQVFLRPES